MLVRVQAVVCAPPFTQQLERTVGDDLVDVHVRRGAGAALDDVHEEVLVMTPLADLLCRLHDRMAAFRIEQSQVAFASAAASFTAAIASMRAGNSRMRDAGDREVFEGPQRLDAVQRLVRHAART